MIRDSKAAGPQSKSDAFLTRRAGVTPEGVMRKQRMLAGSSPCEGYQVAEIRRRVDGCRERLRRNRAARRIAERATPYAFESAEEVPEMEQSPAARGVREEET